MNGRQSIFLYAKVSVLLLGAHAAIGSAVVSDALPNATNIQPETADVLKVEETVDAAAPNTASVQSNLELTETVLLQNIPFIQQLPELAEMYLPDRIVDLTGQPITNLYEAINNGSPVWVITNGDFAPLDESEFETWETSTGRIQITYREHSVLLVGYDTDYVYINDPLADEPNKAVPKELFEQSWVQMGSQAVSYLSI